MEQITVERSIRVNAPRERVWQAVTEPEHIIQWFLPALPGVPMKRDSEGTLSLSMGPMDAAFAVLENIEAPHRVTSRSLPDKQLATTYTLIEENGGTRVTVTMSGFESLPDDARHDRLRLSGENWDRALANLKAHIEGIELPYPQAFVAPLFGFWREARALVAVERSVWINASQERVWQALIDPEKIEMWFAPGTTFKSSGSGVGARLYVEDPQTGAEMYVQIMEVFDPPHRLAMRSVPDTTEEFPFFTSYRLDEENNGTRLTLMYSGYEQLTEVARWKQMEENTFGFGMMLANIKAMLEGTTLPQPSGF
ncbi:MAG TPA: SRPBCC domain-containing protein [Phototrophicaceae bacterium]|jgi:uncharacterized protein YndB with AHSA1/START domain|nr:SRPBCC domain-containing protein [Phototrophicaceae bacterium]